MTIKGRGGQRLQGLDLHRIKHYLPGRGNELPLPTSLQHLLRAHLAQEHGCNMLTVNFRQPRVLLYIGFDYDLQLTRH
jgi:hypothetical protein